MAVPDRHAARALALELALSAAPERHALFQAMRRLECAFRGRPRLGQAARATDVPVRLGQEPALAFAPTSVAAFTADGAATPRLTTWTFGVFGPNGPLPLHLTERAHDRRRHVGDKTLARFADVFHHRMIELFYRAHAHASPAIARDRPEADPFALYVGALFGMGLPSARHRDLVSDLVKLHYAGLLARQTRNAEGLEALAGGVFGVTARVESFVGEWVDIPPGDRARLGRSGALGRDALLGSRVWLRTGRFRLVLGPLSRERLERLLPGTIGFARLSNLVRVYVGDELTWELRLVLARPAWRPLALGAGRLGWTSWIGARPASWATAEVVLDPGGLAASQTSLAPRHEGARFAVPVAPAPAERAHA